MIPSNGSALGKARKPPLRCLNGKGYAVSVRAPTKATPGRIFGRSYAGPGTARYVDLFEDQRSC
jgi:hypothetical protein